MDSVIEHLPGEVQVCVYLGTVIIMSIPMLLIPVRVLQWIGKRRYGSPNWITGWRIPVVVLGVVIYFSGYFYVGFCIVAFGDLLDRMDGKVAKALALLKDPCYPGFTPEGKWWDPMADKMVVLPRLIGLAFLLHLNLIPLVVTIVSDVVGTLIRPPFGFVADKVRLSEASGIGKGKLLFQCFAMLASGFMYQRMFWIPRIPNIFLWCSAFFSVLSVISRLRVHAKVDCLVDRMTSIFEH